ncbi:MAG TPA: excinuclease ABC subunit UvrC, partial [bacterium]|nr:excinuclease ABC subunit UvrC [bacterium]HOL48874.1 excinuclease ABC subunit UvrC [bacterium]HPQ18963.1 excinuclease ABC subunit UvrC [bacterium]
PDKSGVYLFKNKEGKIIYVGKAISIKKRVKSHFLNADNSIKQNYLIKNVFDIDYIITNNETEAFLLESNLIKKYEPKFNVRFKDDKRYPYLAVTIKEKFPRLILTRKPILDCLNFGPFLSAFEARKIIDLAQKLFKIHKCKNPENKKERACLNFNINLCSAPCQNYISEIEYKKQINNLIKFLKGDVQDLINDLKTKMLDESKNYNFEKAAEYRDLINALNNLNIKQFAEKSIDYNYDVIAIKENGNNFVIVKLIVRDGKIYGKENYFFQIENTFDFNDVLDEFFKKEYMFTDFIPKEIIVNVDFENKLIYEKWLSDKTGYKVEINQISKGIKYNTLKLAEKNAENLLKIEEQKFIDKNKLIYDLKTILNLKKYPYYIEAFDISNIAGKEQVASMVVCINGRMQKKFYRRFKIRSVTGIDDFAAIAEVVFRRYKRLKDENEKLPDLIIIDGGKGQLSAALNSLNELNISLNDVDVISIAKKNEEIYLPNQSEPILIPKDSSLLKFIQVIRDEAHRFAINYHKKLRDGKLTFSQLDKIKGIGKKRKELLLKHFGSIYQIKYADIEKLTAIKGITKCLARKIKETLNNLPEN